MNSLHPVKPEILGHALPLTRPDYLPASAWVGHLPFASWLVGVLRPRVLVELGVHNGASYCTFCEAVARQGLSTACFGVDSWEGDPHAGHYGPEVLAQLRAYHDPRYASFSRLVQANFDDALHHFAEGSVDLLHIDGFHTYEAVQHDFESWRPKLSDRAVVLFHDTNVREGSFGVWRFWDEVRLGRPHFAFLHAHGLGVLGVGSEQPEALRRLFAADETEAGAIRLVFGQIGQRFVDLHDLQRRLEDQASTLSGLRKDLQDHEGALTSANAATEQLQAELDLWKDKSANQAAELQSSLDHALTRADELQARFETTVAEQQARYSEIVRERDQLKIASDAAARQAGQATERIAAMTNVGNQLVLELRRAYAHPWRPVRRKLRRAALRALVACEGMLPKRTGERARRSLEKRRATHFQRKWREACGLDTGRKALSNPRPGARGAGAQATALRLLATIVQPFSHRRAARFRRSAEKRDRRKIAEQSQKITDQSAPISDPNRGRRILVADYRLPQPDVSAGELATFGLISDLCASGFEVVFVPTDMRDTTPYRQNLEALGVTVITRASGYSSARDYVRAKGATFGTFYLIRVDMAEALLPSAREAAPDATVVFHAPDLYFLRETRAAELSGDPAQLMLAEKTRDREVAIMRACDHIVLVSPAEVPFLKAWIAREKISVFPALYSRVVDEPAGYGARRNLFFLGGYKHPPNVDAVIWFVERVWPRIHSALPDVEFHIVGAEAPPEVTDLTRVPGVKHIGYVADIDPLLAGYRLSVAPLRYGAGIKGKLGAALGAGVPSVCTTIAAEGMGIVDGVHALVRDEPDAFADAVIALYRDEAAWSRIADSGRILVRENFGEDANRASFLRMLDRMGVLPLDRYIEACGKVAPAAFPVWDSSTPVDVSIIIPVFGKWPLTRRCLNSILMAGRATGLRYEVILADDHSTDETVRAAEIFPGLLVARTQRNLGFLLNCNNAAGRARGRHLLFLNNDTVVLPGWLEPLVRALEDDSRIAIAGSKLLYPDGTIQESGAVLYSDSTAVNLGRGMKRREPLYSLTREVDYATGASMLVRGSFWTEVGGFDERYAPAYCEDSDLAMAARAKGYRVVCVAESEAVHFEHGSYAEESAARPRELQILNGAKLVEKWRSVFARDHMPPGAIPLRVAAHAERQPPLSAIARRSTGKLNVLYFSPYPSHPDNHGNQATIQAFGRRFRALGHVVHFALLEGHHHDEAALAQMRAAWDSVDILPCSGMPSANGQPIPFDGWYEEGIGERIRLLCDKYDIDVVFCSYIFQSRLLDFVPAHILKVIDTHDKMGDRYEMLRKNGLQLEFFSCTPEEEGAYLRRADIVVARRAEEAAYFDSVTGRNSAIIIPHIEEPRFINRTFVKMTDVGMVASANKVNLAIAVQFLRVIERQRGDKPCPFTLHIAGQVRDMIPSLPAEDAELFSRPWIRLHGFVQSIGEFYRGVDVVVSPVTMGTGINVKTVQAMAYGMPLLTTAWGSKGIETGEPMHNHADLDALVNSLFRLVVDSTALASLAESSRRRYQAFYDDSTLVIEGMFKAASIEVPEASQDDRVRSQSM